MRNLRRSSGLYRRLPVGSLVVGIVVTLVGVGCSASPHIQEVRALPRILCPGDSSRAETIYRDVDSVTMTFSPGRAVSLPGAGGTLTGNGVDEGPICTDTLVESVGVLGDKRDSATTYIEVIEGEEAILLEFSAECRCVDRSTSDFRGYAEREIDAGIYSESLLVVAASNESADTVTLSHEGITDTAASGAPFPAFSGSGLRLVGDWLANPVLVPDPGTRYDCCADPGGTVEPTPLPGGGTRRVPYPPLRVQVIAGCPPPPPGVCAP